MKNFLFAGLSWLCCGVTFGQDLVCTDDFAGYAAGAPPAGVWDVLAGDWRIANQQLDVATGHGLCLWRKIPELETLDFSARLTLHSRLGPDDWTTAGIAIILDRRNHWRLNLVEGPDKKRYTELGETCAGEWQAQSAEGTRLRKTKAVMGTWSYGKA